MKQLILGNEAVARGLYEAGCSFVSSYPGTPSTEITEAVAKYPEVYAEWAPNEKVAMEAAFGASLAGRRSFCGMKHVGLNVAADPLFTISYTGVNAGLVIVPVVSLVSKPPKAEHVKFVFSCYDKKVVVPVTDAFGDPVEKEETL